MSIHFANPWVLFLLWLVPLLAAWWLIVRRRLARNLSHFISGEMQQKLLPRSSNRFAWQAVLVCLAVALALASAAGPQWGEREEAGFQRGRDLVILLDVSVSMLANDVHPNRLQRAKADIMDLVRELKGDRAALVAFRRRSSLLCPLTSDHAFLMQAIDAAGVHSAPSGQTDIGDAITKALEAFESDEGSHKAIILISDGEDMVGNALTAAGEAGKKGVPIFAVGLGSSRGSSIPRPDIKGEFVEHDGQQVTTKLDGASLREIAEKSNGAFIRVGTGSMSRTTLGTLYTDHLRKLSSRDFHETLQRRYIERYQWFLLPAVLLLITATLLTRGRLQRTVSPALSATSVPLKDIAGVLLVTLAFVGAPARAQTNTDEKLTAVDAESAGALGDDGEEQIPSGWDGARIAQKLYREGSYQGAADAYIRAARGAGPTAQRHFNFNAAIALYEAGEYGRAAALLGELVASPDEDRAESAMALGAALFREAETATDPDADALAKRERFLRESAEAYKDALKEFPEEDEARDNLGVALHALSKAEEQARAARLAEKYEKSSVAGIAHEMLTEQRALVDDMSVAFSNDTPSRIQELEVIAERQKKNADIWMPFNAKLDELFSQMEDDPDSRKAAEQIRELADEARAQMDNSWRDLRDLNPRGLRLAQKARDGVYPIWKISAPYGQLLKEDIQRQTNALDLTSGLQGQTDTDYLVPAMEQAEGLGLTKLFLDRFKGAMEQEKKQSPQPGVQGTNLPPEQGISEEDQEKVISLAGDAIEAQTLALKSMQANKRSEAITAEKDSYRLLKEIEKILQKQQDQKQDQQQDQDQDQQQNQDPEQNPNQDQKQDPKQQPKQDPKEVPPENVMKILRKALEREKEHEEEKRRRKMRFELSPIGPDV